MVLELGDGSLRFLHQRFCPSELMFEIVEVQRGLGFVVFGESWKDVLESGRTTPMLRIEDGPLPSTVVGRPLPL